MDELTIKLNELSITTDPPICHQCGDSGDLFDEIRRVYLGKCKCQIPKWNLQVWQYIYMQIPDRLSKNLDRTIDNLPKLSDNQQEIFNSLRKRNWIYGPNKLGKSHTSLEYIRHILKTEKKFIQVKYINGHELRELFQSQYDDYQSKNKLKYLGQCNLILIDDIDKVGQSDNTERMLGLLFETVLDKVEYIIFTSNLSIKSFCSRMKNIEIGRAIYTRLNDHLATNEKELKKC